MIVIILIIILFLFLLLLKLTKKPQEYFEIIGFKIELYDNFYQIAGYNGPIYEITIPPTSNNINITRIKNGAFSDYLFKQVDFTGSNITSIGDNSFSNCTLLTSVILPDTLNMIGKDAFKGCSKLSSITFNGIKPTIGNNAFFDIANNVNINMISWNDNDKNNFKIYSNKNINFIDLNNIKVSSDGSTIIGYNGTSDTVIIPLKINGINIIAIGNNAFKSKNFLNEIIISNNIRRIGSNAFNNCYNISNFIIPNSVTYIETGAFNCGNLKEIKFDGILPTMEPEVFLNFNTTIITVYHHLWSKANIDEFTTKNSLQKFNFVDLGYDKSLSNAASIVGQTPSALVGKMLTEYSTSSIIKTTTSNITTKSIQSDFVVSSDGTLIIFNGKSAEVLIPLTINGINITKIGNNLFENKTFITKIYWGKKDGNESYVSSIGDSAFSGCTGIQNIKLPDSITVIGESAFYYCTELTSITLSNNLTTIDTEAFNYCVNLTDIKLPNSLIKIGMGAFFDCHGLSSIIFPNNLDIIDTKAFYRCYRIKNITFNGKIPTTIGELAFFWQLRGITNVYVPNSWSDDDINIIYKCFSYYYYNLNIIRRYCNNILTNGDFRYDTILAGDNNYNIYGWKYDYNNHKAILYDIYNYNSTKKIEPRNPADYIDYPNLIPNGTIMVLLLQNSSFTNYIQQGSFSSVQATTKQNMFNVSAPIGVYKEGIYTLQATVLRKKTTEKYLFKYNIGLYYNGLLITPSMFSFNTAGFNAIGGSLTVSVKKASDGTVKTYKTNTDITDEGTVTLKLTITKGSTLIGKNIGVQIYNKTNSFKTDNGIFISDVKLVSSDSCTDMTLF